MEANTPNRMENHRKKSKQKVECTDNGHNRCLGGDAEEYGKGGMCIMRKTTEFKAENRLTVDIEGLMAMLSCGEVTAKKIADYAEARVIIGRRVLYNVDKIKKYLDAMAV